MKEGGTAIVGLEGVRSTGIDWEKEEWVTAECKAGGELIFVLLL